MATLSSTQSKLLITARAVYSRARRAILRGSRWEKPGTFATRGGQPGGPAIGAGPTSKDVVGALMMRCPASERIVNSGIIIQQADVSRLARFELSVRCPHCGEPHELRVSDTFIDARGVLP